MVAGLKWEKHNFSSRKRMKRQENQRKERNHKYKRCGSRKFYTLTQLYSHTLPWFDQEKPIMSIQPWLYYIFSYYQSLLAQYQHATVMWTLTEIQTYGIKTIHWKSFYILDYLRMTNNFYKGRSQDAIKSTTGNLTRLQEN